MSSGLSAVLDVIIGLSFVFLMASLIASAVVEVISSVRSWRSGTLHEGLKNLLSDPDGKALVAMIYEHHLIKSLGRKGAKSGETKKPSYIPANRFAMALTDVLKRTAVNGTFAADGVRRGGVPMTRTDASMTVRGFRSDSAPAGLNLHALGTAAVGTSIDLIRNREAAFQDMRSLIGSLPETDVKQSLLAMAERAEGKIEDFERLAAQWFDDTMDRVAGWYKRKTQTCLFVVGFAIAFFLNVNAIELARTLWIEPELRAVIVANASKIAEKNPEIGSGETPALKKVREDLDGLDLPLGWKLPFESTPSLFDVVVALVGWLLSAIAISFGAPFWFNALNKLLAIRAAGRVPKKSEGEAVAN